MSSPKSYATGAVEPPPTQGGGCTLRYVPDAITELGADFSGAAKLLVCLKDDSEGDHTPLESADI